MARNYIKDLRRVNLSEDLESIVKLYPANEFEVRNFLIAENTSWDLYGAQHENIYDLIANKLGYPRPN